MIGINANLDYLHDQQQGRTERFPGCDCCRRSIYAGEKFYVLNMIRDEIIICTDCKHELDNSACTVEDVSPLN